jgi:Raf kinase inhibitor-like YbhB/YbcL family protein
MVFRLIAQSFPDGGDIPATYSCDGADLSPALEWRDAPSGTRSFALLLRDRDAPGGFTHWVLWDIASSVYGLVKGFKPAYGGESGTNDFGRQGYNGPCPPRGGGAHRYVFTLYALDAHTLKLKPGARAQELESAMRGHVLAEARYMGRFERH